MEEQGMNIALIKKINERLPYGVKRPFSRLIRNKLIKNKDFVHQYEELQLLDELDREGRRQYQLARLKEMLRYAKENSPYYAQRFAAYHFSPETLTSVDDLKVLPVLTKKELQTNFAQIASQDHLDYYEVSTGGTTGKPVKIMMERKAIFREWAFVYHYWSKFGYDYKKSKLATFRGVDFGERLSVINPLYREIRLNPMRMNRSNVSLYMNDIDTYGADFLYGYPSAVYNFCRLCRQAGIHLQKRFKAVFLISENLYDYQRDVIGAVLDAPVAMFYGHSERAVFAESDEGGRYQFNPAYGVWEFSDKGEMIVTGFINRKMPLIRYLVDDYATGSERDGFSIYGHHDAEVLYGRDGEQISVAAINFHDDTFANVAAYQFIQEEPGRAVMNIKPEKALSQTEQDSIQQRVNSKLGSGLTVTVALVDDMQLSARGKYKMIIQHFRAD